MNKISNNKKYANEILDDIECYKLVLDGRIKKFPNGFWTKPWSEQSSAVITRYLLEERLKYTEEDIKTKADGNIFRDNRLTSLVMLFNGSTYDIINNAYPDRFKPWELNRVPNKFWEDKNNIKEVIKWLVENKLDNTRERVCKEFSAELLTKYNLTTIAKYGIYNLINITYPKQFKPWELNNVSSGFWEDKNNIKQAVRWLVESKLDNNRERVCKEFNTDILSENALRELGKIGLYKVLDIAYPNEFKPWELSNVSSGFWEDKNNIKQAVRWLVETKLDNNRERVCKEFTKELITSNGARELAYIGVYNVLNMTYPNEFKPWELKAVSPRFWEDDNNIIEAVRWLVETKLDNSKERVCKEFTHKLLKECGLISITKVGVYNLLNMAYPNQFKPTDFKCHKRMK